MNTFSIKENPRAEELRSLYRHKRQEIELRLREFRGVWKAGTGEDIFTELVFCILTPQASGKLCWAAVETMIQKGLIFNGDASAIAKELKGARFINKKSAYVVEAREMGNVLGIIIIRKDHAFRTHAACCGSRPIPVSLEDNTNDITFCDGNLTVCHRFAENTHFYGVADT